MEQGFRYWVCVEFEVGAAHFLPTSNAPAQAQSTYLPSRAERAQTTRPLWLRRPPFLQTHPFPATPWQGLDAIQTRGTMSTIARREKPLMRSRLAVVLGLLSLSLPLQAQETAPELRDAGYAALKAAQTDPERFAEAAKLLTRAAEACEAAKDEASAQEVNAALYWVSKKMPDEQNDNFVDKEPDIAIKVHRKMAAVYHVFASRNDAGIWLAKADEYAKGAKDPFFCAVRYFEVASRFEGTPEGKRAQEKSLEALQKAKVAQRAGILLIVGLLLIAAGIAVTIVSAVGLSRIPNQVRQLIAQHGSKEALKAKRLKVHKGMPESALAATIVGSMLLLYSLCPWEPSWWLAYIGQFFTYLLIAVGVSVGSWFALAYVLSVEDFTVVPIDEIFRSSNYGPCLEILEEARAEDEALKEFNKQFVSIYVYPGNVRIPSVCAGCGAPLSSIEYTWELRWTKVIATVVEYKLKLPVCGNCVSATDIDFKGYKFPRPQVSAYDGRISNVHKAFADAFKGS